MKKNSDKKKLADTLIFLLFIRPAMDILVTIDIFSIGGIAINISQIWGLLFIILSIIFILINKTNFLESNLQKIIFLFTVLAIIPLFFFTNDKLLGFIKFSKWLVWILCLIVFYDIFKNRIYRVKFAELIMPMSWFVVIIYFFSLILSEVLGISYRTSTELYAYGKHQFGFRGFFESTHAMTFLSIFLLMLVQVKKIYYNPGYKNYFFVSIALSMVVISALSRTGILALLVFSAFLLRGNKKQFIVIGFSLILFSTLIFTEDVIESRIMKDYQILTEEEDKSGLGSGRIGMWTALYSYYQELNIGNKIIGGGFDADFRATEKYFYRRGAHNDFFDILLNNGLIAFILYVLFLAKLKSKSFVVKKNKQRLQNYLSGIFYTVITIMFFQGITVVISMIFFIVISMLLYWENKRLYLSEPKI